ncbi:DUF1016 N-terminal domain-containing protein, partial [Paraburkholderia strydomiana]|uniref:DUF1016 N-terminal domain-containing protein n=1 Tax=Paraburkholderia strydomiana TaxID=1245417 RepID=UPI001BEB3BA9|nr:hypothetical protein [Paraburkholderia strydomiana]
MTKKDIASDIYAGLQREIGAVVESTRAAAVRSVNALMTATYWQIGRRIVEFEQGGEGRAAYGDALIRRLGNDLSQRFGRGFGWRNLAQMRAFYLAWPAEQIVQTAPAISTHRPPFGASARNTPEPGVVAQAFPLPWSAYVRLLSVKTAAARAFYETEALREGWSVRQLDRQIASQLYERLALSRNKAALLKKAAHFEPGDQLTPEEAIRDPFVLEFLDIRDEYSSLRRLAKFTELAQ